MTTQGAEHVRVDYSTNNEVSVGMEKMKLNFLTFFFTVILIALLDSPFDAVSDDTDDEPFEMVLEVLGALYFFLLRPVFEYSADMIFVKGVRDEKPQVGEIFEGFKKYKNVVLANLLVVALVALSLIFFIVPGIYVGCRLAFVSYLVMDKDMSAQEAVEKSWQLTENRAGKIFVLGLGAVVISILGFMCLIIGIIPAIMWIKSYFAAYYQMTLNEYGSADQEN